MLSRFPPEIEGFLRNPWGKSLIIRGSAGSGKTTLALEMMENVFTPQKSVYLSTRVGDQSIYNQFPWVKESDSKNRIIDAGKRFLRTINPKTDVQQQSEVLISGNEVLRSLVNQRPDKVVTYNLDSLGINSAELERTIDSLNLIMKQKPALIIDSIEGISRKLGIEEDKMIFALQKDIVENSGIDLVIVSESDVEGKLNRLDYLVDGVITLHKEFIDSRIIRNIRLEKMRYTQIESNEYDYTLDGGRFAYIPPTNYIGTYTYNHETDLQGIVTGINFIDKKIMDVKGKNAIAFNFINIKTDVAYSLLVPSIVKALKENKGILYLGDPDKGPMETYAFINEALPLKDYENNIRIVDLENDVSGKRFIAGLGQTTKEERMREYMRNIVELSDSTDGILFIESTRALEKLEGSRITDEIISRVSSNIRGTKDSLIMMNHDAKLIGTINQIFDIVVNVERKGNTILTYGVSPYTQYYGVYPDVNNTLRMQIIT